MEYRKYLLQDRFFVVKRSPKHPKVDSRNTERISFHLGIIWTLLVLIILAVTFPKKETGEKVRSPYVSSDFVLTVENIPETKHERLPPPPPRMPVVPVESEEIQEVMEELVFEVESLNFADIPQLPDVYSRKIGVAVSARPIIESIPRFPESELAKGHEGAIEMRLHVDKFGNVTEVKIIKNTTKSKVLEDLVIKAVLESKYRSARDKNNQPIATWTSRTYTFKLKGK